MDIRLRRLVRTFALEPLDLELLLVALAPDLDPRFERLYGYLHDDVSRRRASIGLALELAGAGGASGPGRARLGPAGPLIEGGLLVVEDADRPFLTRGLRVPDRVAGHLVGDDTTDPLVAALEVTPARREIAGIETLARGLRAGARLAYVRERIGTAPVTMAAGALARLGPPPVVVDLGRLGPREEIGDAATAAIREARLRGTGLVAGPVEVLAERGAAAVRAFAEAPCVAVLHGSRGWDPSWSRTVAFLVEGELPSARERHDVWLAALDGSATDEMTHSDRGPPLPAGARAGRPCRRSRPPDRGGLGTSARGRRRRGGRPVAERGGPRSPGAPCRAPGRLVGPGPADAGGGAAGRADRAGPASGPRPRRLGPRPDVAQGARGHRAVRRRLGNRQDHVGRGDRGVARPRPLRDRPLDDRGQVHRRDGEEPRPGLQRGRSRQWRAALRRGRRHLRQALRGEGRARPLCQRRGRLPAPADGGLRRHGHPDDEPPGKRRRGLPPPTGRHRRLPACRTWRIGGGSGSATWRPASRSPTTSTSTSWPTASRCPEGTSAT